MTELRDLTLRFRSCERLFIRLSVKPSLKYSVSALPPTFAKGNTAIESISVLVFLAGRNTAIPSPSRIKTTRPRPIASLCCLIPVTTEFALKAPIDGTAEGAVVESAGCDYWWRRWLARLVGCASLEHRSYQVRWLSFLSATLLT